MGTDSNQHVNGARALVNGSQDKRGTATRRVACQNGLLLCNTKTCSTCQGAPFISSLCATPASARYWLFGKVTPGLSRSRTLVQCQREKDNGGLPLGRRGFPRQARWPAATAASQQIASDHATLPESSSLCVARLGPAGSPGSGLALPPHGRAGSRTVRLPSAIWASPAGERPPSPGIRGRGGR